MLQYSIKACHILSRITSPVSSSAASPVQRFKIVKLEEKKHLLTPFPALIRTNATELLSRFEE